MAVEQTLERMRAMRLSGMAAAYLRDAGTERITDMSFEERLALLVDHEWVHRESNRIARLVKKAKFRVDAVPEEIDYQHPRGLKKTVMQQLLQCTWIQQKHNLILCGPTGVGKTFLACALGQAACRHSLSVRYFRISALLRELAIAHGDGEYMKLLRELGKTDLLIIDDWGLVTLSPRESRDILEVVELRTGNRSTLIASQLPSEHWHQSLGDSTIADAILDRLVHDAHHITLRGDSLRKARGSLGSQGEQIASDTNDVNA